jgi:hypothetical protein
MRRAGEGGWTDIRGDLPKGRYGDIQTKGDETHLEAVDVLGWRLAEGAPADGRAGVVVQAGRIRHDCNSIESRFVSVRAWLPG